MQYASKKIYKRGKLQSIFCNYLKEFAKEHLKFRGNVFMNNLKRIISLTAIISIILSSSIVTSASEDLYVKLKIGDTTAYINATESKLEAAPFIDPTSNRTLVPLRFISEAFNAEVEWEEAKVTKELLDADANKISQVENVKNINITIKEGNSPDVKYPITWYLRVGKKDAWNSKDVKKEDAFYDNSPSGNLESREYQDKLSMFSKDMEQAPVIINGRTMVPLRFIAETLLNLKVEWNANTKTIILKQNTEVRQPEPQPTSPVESEDTSGDISFTKIDTTKVNKLELVSTAIDSKINNENCFYVPRSYNIKKSIENEIVTWTIDTINNSSGSFLLQKIKDEKIFLSRPTYPLYENSDNIDITSLIKSTELDISKLNFEVVDIADFESHYVVLKLWDGKVSALLYSRWDYGKNLSNNIYNTQDISSINIITYEGIDVNVYNEYFAFKRNGKYYISEYNRSNTEMKVFELPEEITDIYWMKSTANIESGIIMTYLKGIDKNSKPSFYSIDYTNCKIAEYPYVEDLKDKSALKWSFKGDLDYYTVLDESDDLLIMYGHDGRISGYHDYEEVVAVRKSTGELVWNISNKDSSISSSISRDKKRIYILMESWLGENNRLVCLDIETGKKLWEQELTESISIINSCKYPAKMNMVNDDNIIVSFKDDGNKYKIQAFDAFTGKSSWTYAYDSYQYISGLLDNSVVVIANSKDNSITALDTSSGTIKWQNNFTGSSKILSNDLNIENKNSSFFGIPFEDGTRIFDAFGKEICTLSGYYTKSIYNGFVVCYEQEKETTEIYSLEQKKIVYSTDGEIQSLLTEDGKIFFSSQSKSGCIELATGKVLWESPIGDLEFEEVAAGILWARNKYFVNYGGYVWAFDLNSGKLLFQVGDYNSGYYNPIINMGQKIFVSGSTIYINKLNCRLEALELNQSK